MSNKEDGTHQEDTVRWNYQFEDQNLSAEALRSHSVPLIHVPRGCHFGIQTVLEYEEKKRKRIEQRYAGMSPKEIVELLERHPVHSVAIPQNPQDSSKWSVLEDDAIYHIAILDGHHRTRYSNPLVRHIPTLVMTAEQAAEVYFQRYNKDVERFVGQVTGEMNGALHSFVNARENLRPYPVYFFQHAGKKEVGLVGHGGLRTHVTSVRRAV